MDERQEPVEETTKHDDFAGHPTTVRSVDPPLDGDRDDEQEERLAGAGGRLVSAIASIALLVGLFLAWYHVVRPNGFAEDTTGWQTFTKLRFVIIAAAVAGLVTTLVRPTRALPFVRLALGVVASLLVIRRVISPPDLDTSTVTSKVGIYVSLLGGLGLAFGGLLGFGSGAEEDDEDSDAEPIAAGPAPALAPGGEEVVVTDAEVVEDDAGVPRHG
jgi:hypothetical protein